MKKNVVMAVVFSVLLMGFGLTGVAQAGLGGRDYPYNAMQGGKDEAKQLSLNDYFFPGFVQINFWGAPPRPCILGTDTLYDHLDWLTGFRDQLQTLLDRINILIAQLDGNPADPDGDTPNAVPVPGAALLLGSAMVALAGLRRRVQL